MTLPTYDARQPTDILVAEDNSYDRLILQEAFDALDLPVRLRFVTNGEDLLDCLRGRNDHAGAALQMGAPWLPAIVLLDLNMPRMNGSEALREMRADAALRMLPVVILSTSDNPKQVAQAYADGVNAFMTKPGRFDEFVALLRKFSDFWLDGAQLPVIAGPGIAEALDPTSPAAGTPCVSC